MTALRPHRRPAGAAAAGCPRHCRPRRRHRRPQARPRFLPAGRGSGGSLAQLRCHRFREPHRQRNTQRQRSIAVLNYRRSIETRRAFFSGSCSQFPAVHHAAHHPVGERPSGRAPPLLLCAHHHTAPAAVLDEKPMPRRCAASRKARRSSCATARRSWVPRRRQLVKRPSAVTTRIELGYADFGQLDLQLLPPRATAPAPNRGQGGPLGDRRLVEILDVERAIQFVDNRGLDGRFRPSMCADRFRLVDRLLLFGFTLTQCHQETRMSARGAVAAITTEGIVSTPACSNDDTSTTRSIDWTCCTSSCATRSPRLTCDRRRGVEIDQRDLDLTTVTRVDGAGAVDDRKSYRRSQSGSRVTEPSSII